MVHNKIIIMYSEKAIYFLRNKKETKKKQDGRGEKGNIGAIGSSGSSYRAVSYEIFFSRIIWVGGPKKFLGKENVSSFVLSSQKCSIFDLEHEYTIP